MSDPGTCAVIYAAKSTEDKHGSIPTQVVDSSATAGTVVGDAPCAFSLMGVSLSSQRHHRRPSLPVR